nr:hypothetical protein 1 [Forsythia suspensa noda-like virus]
MVAHKVHIGRPWSKCPHRALVYTIPTVTYCRLSWYPTEFKFRKLRPVNYACGFRPGYNRLYDESGPVPMVSVGRAGELLNFKIPRVDLEALMSCATSQSVMSRVVADKIGSDNHNFVALISQYFAGRSSNMPVADCVSASIPLVTTPTAHYPVYNLIDTPDVSMRQYTNPIVDNPSLAPMIRRWEAMSSTIENRITTYANSKVPNMYAARAAVEFIDCLTPVKHELHPYSYEQVIELLDKPSQVLAVNNVLDDLPFPARSLIEAFEKNEPCNKDGRPIANFADMRFVMRVSRYTLAYSDLVAKTDRCAHFYFPGRNCSQVEQGVSEYFQANGGKLAETDFENLDGTVSEWLQTSICQASLLAAFDKCYHDDIKQLMKDIIHAPARAKRFGFKFVYGVGVKSGSPTTTVHNTLINAFVEFYALRRSALLNEREPDVAFRSLGPKYGDDGLISSSNVKAINLAAKDLGLRLKVEHYDPVNGLTFIGRCYVNLPDSLHNTCDPLRTFRKLHLTSRDKLIPLADAAYDRAEGYLITDNLTPVVGSYFKFIQRYYGPLVPDHDKRLARRSQRTERPYWSNHGTWTQLADQTDHTYEVFAHRTGISVQQLKAFDTVVNAATSLEALPPVLSVDCPYKNHIGQDLVHPLVGPTYQQLQDATNSRADVRASAKAGNPGKQNGQSVLGAKPRPANAKRPVVALPDGQQRSNASDLRPSRHDGKAKNQKSDERRRDANRDAKPTRQQPENKPVSVDAATPTAAS